MTSIDALWQPPKDLPEYQKRFAAAQSVSGSGLDTTMHMPCPFCAYPNWSNYRIVDTETAMAEERVCQKCGRGAKALFTREGEGVSFEIVQTRGDDIPDFLPKIRRV